ncbi:MAG: hypothetical protein ACFFDW_10155 [Candidatus Thorarchaeota archaeon]
MSKATPEKIEKISITLRTEQKRFAPKKETSVEFYIGKHRWRLANAKPEDIDKGHQGVFDLVVPPGMTSDWFRYLCLKRVESKGDVWTLKEIKLTINDKVIYHKANADVKLKADTSSWCAPDFTYGQG